MPHKKVKKKVEQPKRKQKIIHAQIKSPVLVRKTILEASILSLENLKILRNIRQIKRRKAKLKADLRKECREMNEITAEFLDVIPSLGDIGLRVQKESERDLMREISEEGKKRFEQERLISKSVVSKESVFEQKDELDFSIDKLKEKIKGL